MLDQIRPTANRNEEFLYLAGADVQDAVPDMFQRKEADRILLAPS